MCVPGIATLPTDRKIPDSQSNQVLTLLWICMSSKKLVSQTASLLACLLSSSFLPFFPSFCSFFISFVYVSAVNSPLSPAFCLCFRPSLFLRISRGVLPQHTISEARIRAVPSAPITRCDSHYACRCSKTHRWKEKSECQWAEHCIPAYRSAARRSIYLQQQDVDATEHSFRGQSGSLPVASALPGGRNNLTKFFHPCPAPQCSETRD